MAARRKYVLRKFKTALLSRDAAENADPRATSLIPLVPHPSIQN